MDTEIFLSNFVDLFDENPPTEVTMDTEFRNLDDWSSFIGLSIIAMVDEKYNTRISADELRSCITIGEIFTLVKGKL